MKRFYCPLLFAFLFVAVVASLPAQVTNLGIATVGNQTLLVWPTGASNYVLQSTTNLTSSNWVPVTNAVTVQAAVVPAALPAMYFRLFNPQAFSTNGMVLIPAGAYTMGDTLDGNTKMDAYPISVNVSAFLMDSNLVTYGMWQAVYSWATNQGYSFDNAGAGIATNHPVQTLDWYDCVKWCNARSQKAGFAAAYYTEPGLTNVYMAGDVDAVYVNWTNGGYRLPTEAEWEKAARGGLITQRFPFGNFISETNANYYGFTGASGGYYYDFGPNGYNALFSAGSQPYTSPVGSFPPNGYGLNDMAGNVLEWCHDWAFTPYEGGTDPQGPSTGDHRILRGGSWQSDADGARCARRWPSAPQNAYNVCGFRCVTSF
jgi:formylglycine-generating enzyme required for sulfatase activity